MAKSVMESVCRRAIHTTIPSRVLPIPRVFASQIHSRTYATALPITTTGPPPPAPSPSPQDYNERIAQRRKKAALLEQGKAIRAAQSAPSKSPLRKRFWQHVHVIDTPEGYQIHLDKRPVRRANKQILTIPKNKPHLAHAIAIEWDLLVSAQQALKEFNIPMTGIASRALDIAEDDAKSDGVGKTREDIVTVMMRYLDTDTLLCWAPERSAGESTLGISQGAGQSLRDMQRKAAEEVLGFLNATVWPGVEIRPVLDGDSILPARQSEVSRNIIKGWIAGLGAWELAGLERAVLATKSLLVGVRLVAEWSEELNGGKGGKTFGVEEAALASTIEVRWQTGMWGEVEDTHDVEKEDVRRQLGSAVLVVSGSK